MRRFWFEILFVLLLCAGVTYAQFPGSPIGGVGLTPDSIDSEHYIDGSIDAAHLAADVIDETKIADEGIDSEHYNDGSIDPEHLALNEGQIIVGDATNKCAATSCFHRTSVHTTVVREVETHE